MKTKPETLARLRELDSKATAGPWFVQKHDSEMLDGSLRTFWDVGERSKPRLRYYQENAALIAAMRNALPGLLDDLERMREVLEETHALLGICSDLVICGDFGVDYGCEVPDTQQILADQYKMLSATLKELEADK